MTAPYLSFCSGYSFVAEVGREAYAHYMRRVWQKKNAGRDGVG